MDAQVVVAIISTIGTIIVAAIGAGWIARRRGQRPNDGLAAGWRAQAELSAARATLLEEQVADRDRELGRLRSDLGRTQTDLDNCVRQRQDALTELAGIRSRRRGQGTTR